MTGANKRGRGRPQGTGLDDGPALAKMANLMVHDPVLRPTTAAKRVLKSPNEATIRRLQAKWKASGEWYLEQARAKRDANAPHQTGTGTSNRTLRQIALAQRAAGFGLGGTKLGSLHDALNSPALRAIRAAQENPTVRAMQEIYNRPEVRLIRELYDSPTMRLAREMDKLRHLSGGF